MVQIYNPIEVTDNDITEWETKKLTEISRKYIYKHIDENDFNKELDRIANLPSLLIRNEILKERLRQHEMERDMHSRFAIQLQKELERQ